MDTIIIPKKTQISQAYYNVDSIFESENKKIASNYERFSSEVLKELSELKGNEKDKFNDILDNFFDGTYRNVNYLLKNSNKSIFKSIQENVNLINKQLDILVHELEKRIQSVNKLHWVRRMDLSRLVSKMAEFLKHELESEERYFLKVVKHVNDDFESKLDSFINHSLFKSINMIEMNACERPRVAKYKKQDS